MEAPGHSRQLLLQLNNQRTKGFLCDVIIVVQNALFRAHKNVLAASSAYLKSLVVHDNLLNLDHDMVSPAVFRLVLDFIYTGRLTDSVEAAAAAAVAPGTEPSLGAVLAAASYLQIPDLVALCKKRLKRHGKYCHLRGGGSGGSGYAPYGRPGRGLRAATPVIQACYSSPAGPPPPPAAVGPRGRGQHPLRRAVCLGSGPSSLTLRPGAPLLSALRPGSVQEEPSRLLGPGATAE